MNQFSPQFGFFIILLILSTQSFTQLLSTHPRVFFNKRERDVNLIKYILPKISDVELIIYNQRIRTLVNQRQPAGVYEVQWDGENEHGTPASSAIYICRLKVGNFNQVCKNGTSAVKFASMVFLDRILVSLLLV